MATVSGAPIQRGQALTVEITGITHDGAGVGRHHGFALFVPGTAPGDRVLVRVTEVKKGYGKATLVRVEQPGPARIVPRCPLVAQCGGCQLQHIDYIEQLALKRQQVQEALARLGGMPDVPVHPTLGMADPWLYRGKAQFPVGLLQLENAPAGGNPLEPGPGRKVVGGFYAPGSHRIVDIADCVIQNPTANRILAKVKELAGKYRVPIYDEHAHRGVLRHVLARVARHGGEAMAVLVTNTAELPGAQALARELMHAVPEVVSVLQNINPQRTNVVLGEETRLIAGRETIIDRIDDLEFEISARSFFQVNPEQCEALYGVALEYAGLTGKETVVDAYCGIGTITLMLARHAGEVFGVEVVPEAIEDARANAQRNGIANASFVLGESERVLPRLAAEGIKVDVTVVDPPRKGCEPEVLAAMADLAPVRMVYVSCNPATLARDLKILAGRGYRTVQVQPVDMFPQTAHIESVALLVRDDHP